MIFLYRSWLAAAYLAFLIILTLVPREVRLFILNASPDKPGADVGLVAQIESCVALLARILQLHRHHGPQRL